MDAASIPGLSEEVNRNVAEDYVEPYTGKRLGETKSVKTATIGGDGISILLWTPAHAPVIPANGPSAKANRGEFEIGVAQFTCLHEPRL